MLLPFGDDVLISARPTLCSARGSELPVSRVTEIKHAATGENYGPKASGGYKALAGSLVLVISLRIVGSAEYISREAVRCKIYRESA